MIVEQVWSFEPGEWPLLPDGLLFFARKIRVKRTVYVLKIIHNLSMCISLFFASTHNLAAN